MSIKVMSYIWEHSPHKGSELITLLAIADYADDQGIAYPSIASLSKKTRMTERNVDHVLKKLVRQHALTIARQAGPYRNNVYSIQLPTRKDGHGEKFSGGGGEKFSPSNDEKFSPSIPSEIPTESTEVASHQPVMVKSFQGWMVKTSAEKMTPVFTQTIIRDPSEEDPLKKEKETDTAYQSSEGTENTVPSLAAEVGNTATPVAPQSKPKKVRKPLSDKGWLYPLLQEYGERFDVDAFNDEDWWKDIANSLPASTFTHEFMRLALADLAGWLNNNPAKVPRSQLGWRKRMNYSINYFYDNKYAKRAQATTMKRESRL
jgi:hypothetical protein